MRARSASTSRGSECRQTEKTPPRQRIEAVLDQRSQPVPIDVVGTLAGFLEDRGLDPEYIGNRGAHLLGKSTDAAERAPGLLGSREVDAFELKAWPPRRFTALLRRAGEIEACGGVDVSTLQRPDDGQSCASSIEHVVEHGDADYGFSALRGLATSAQPRADDPLVVAHRGLDQRAPPVARDLLPAHAPDRRVGASIPLAVRAG